VKKNIETTGMRHVVTIVQENMKIWVCSMHIKKSTTTTTMKQN